MPSLTADQLATVADSITGLATAINDYLVNNTVAEPNYSKLNALRVSLAQAAAKMDETAVTAEFADSADAFARLSAAADAANATAASLNDEVAQISKVVGVASKVVDLAGALSGGAGAVAILAAAQNVVTAAH